MDSFLIIGGTEEEKNKKIREMLSLAKISQYDIFILKPKLSIGIAEVRELERWLFLQPYQSPKKAAIIYQAEKLTPEAQNALLKNLEEPPKNTLFILLTDSPDLLIPTIISRCQLIKIFSQKKLFLNQNEKEEFLNSLKKFFTASLGEKFREIEKLSLDKESAIFFIDKSISLLREGLLNTQKIDFLPPKKIPEVIKSFNKAKDYLQANVSPHFVLENLFLEYFF